MKKPRLAPEVEAELDDIWLYVTNQSGNPEIADRLIDTITDRFYLLANNPFLGRRRDFDLKSGVRSFPVGNYLIFYQVEEGSVLILHVLHGRRNLELLF